MAIPEEDPYAVAARDPEYYAALRAQYRGSWDVLDALWWLSHPLDDAPSGRAAPQRRLETLHYLVFSAHGGAAGDDAVVGQMRELEAEIKAEAAALDAVLSAVGESSARHPHVTEDVGSDAEVLSEPAATGPGIEKGATAAMVSAVPSVRRRLLLAGGMAGALLLAGIIGSQLTASHLIMMTPEPVLATQAPEPSLLATVIFERPQQPGDVPSVAVSSAFQPTTFRYLGAAGWPYDQNAVGPSPYYVVRGADDLLCLVVVPENTTYLSTCAPESAFPAAGLQLYWAGPNLTPDAPPDAILDVTLVWHRTGAASLEWAERSATP